MDQFEYVTDPDELFSYFYTGSYSEFFDVLTNPAFPWERLNEMFSSDRLTSSRLKTLIIFVSLWDEDTVDFRVLLSQLYRFYEGESISSFDLSFFGLLRQALDVDCIANRKKGSFVFPVFFVEGLYDLYMKGSGDEDITEPFWWVLFAGYPSVSDDFRKKVWLENRDSIVQVFSSDGWLDEVLYGTYLWDNVPREFLVELFISTESCSFASFCLERYPHVWRETLILSLSEVYDVSMLNVLSTSWLHELLFTVNFDKKIV